MSRPITYEQLYRKAVAKFGPTTMLRYKLKDGNEYDIRIGAVEDGKFRVAIVAQSLKDADAQMDRNMYWQHHEDL